jgi:hypothetical protein
LKFLGSQDLIVFLSSLGIVTLIPDIFVIVFSIIFSPTPNFFPISSSGRPLSLASKISFSRSFEIVLGGN